MTPEKVMDVSTSLPSSVISTAGMFEEAVNFNSNINSWDTSNVNDMATMFRGATSFNQPLNNWNTSSVTKMNEMFNRASISINH